MDTISHGFYQSSLRLNKYMQSRTSEKQQPFQERDVEVGEKNQGSQMWEMKGQGCLSAGAVRA